MYIKDTVKLLIRVNGRTAPSQCEGGQRGERSDWDSGGNGGDRPPHGQPFQMEDSELEKVILFLIHC